MNLFRQLLDIVCVISGSVNLAFYAFGDHAQANLAVGLFCFFAALWNGPRKFY